MTVNELLDRVREQMGDNSAENLRIISDTAKTLRREENAPELLEALTQFAFSQMPEEDRKMMEETTFAAGRRMDQTFAQALKLIDRNEMQEAEKLLEAISDKIAEKFEGGEKTWFTFRNPFEYHTYRMLFPENTDFDRAPFDFSHYLNIYAYVLMENGKTRQAAAAAQRAVSFNPVGADVRFELAEIYKFANALPQLLDTCQAAMPLCTTADRMARVASDLGFYCAASMDLYSAAVFYFESMRFLPSPATEAELQDVIRRMNTSGQKFAPPTEGQVLDTYNKYSVMQPPNGMLIRLALVMAEQAKENDRPDLEGLFFRTAYDMTNDPEYLAKAEDAGRRMEAKES